MFDGVWIYVAFDNNLNGLQNIGSLVGSDLINSSTNCFAKLCFHLKSVIKIKHEWVKVF